jgi:hypothetical protein
MSVWVSELFTGPNLGFGAEGSAGPCSALEEWPSPTHQFPLRILQARLTTPSWLTALISAKSVAKAAKNRLV